MARELTREELEAQLREKRSAIKDRIDALQGEVMTTGEALKGAVTRNPWVGVGGAVLAGVVVGLLFGGRRRDRDPFGAGYRHKQLIDGYLDALADDLRREVGRGKDAETALRDAFRERVPLIVYAPRGAEGAGGVWRNLFDMSLRTVAGFAIQALVDYATARLAVTQAQAEQPPPDPAAVILSRMMAEAPTE